MLSPKSRSIRKMNFFSLLLVSISTLVLILSQPGLADVERRCLPPGQDESLVYRTDFDWNLSLEETANRFKKIYESGKRLQRRAHWDERLKAYVFSDGANKAKIDPVFLRSVIRHVEIALEKGYAEHVFFPDMGHSHFHLPAEDFESSTQMEKKDKLALQERIMANRRLKILYHTAEQIKLVGNSEKSVTKTPTDWMLWRYFTRNIVGDNNGGENVSVLFARGSGYNTVGQMKGHISVGGFYISASKDGCFAYRHNGKRYFFDLSLEALAVDPNFKYDESEDI
jgi:hypothetical protein